MNFTFAHNNLNVYDLEKSLDFYQKALNLKVERENLPMTKVLSLYISQTV